MPHLVHIAYGSNLGDSLSVIKKALTAIAELSSVELLANSSIYSSKAWGYSSDNLFYNGVCSIRTSLSVYEVLKALQRIEKTLGKTPKTKEGYSDRVIDLDIITYGRLVLKTTTLTVPHGLAHVRNFVLEPLSEISPEWVHPLYLETAETLLDRIKNADALTKLDAL